MEKITFTLSVHSIRYEGASTRLIELRPPAGTYLPPVEAGAHIDVHISPTITRQYSLCNTPGETHRYIIGVALDPCSRGGSRALHEVIKEGDTLNIGGVVDYRSKPSQNFTNHVIRTPIVHVA